MVRNRSRFADQWPRTLLGLETRFSGGRFRESSALTRHPLHHFVALPRHPPSAWYICWRWLLRKILPAEERTGKVDLMLLCPSRPCYICQVPDNLVFTCCIHLCCRYFTVKNPPAVPPYNEAHHSCKRHTPSFIIHFSVQHTEPPRYDLPRVKMTLRHPLLRNDPLSSSSLSLPRDTRVGVAGMCGDKLGCFRAHQ